MSDCFCQDCRDHPGRERRLEAENAVLKEQNRRMKALLEEVKGFVEADCCRDSKCCESKREFLKSLSAFEDL